MDPSRRARGDATDERARKILRLWLSGHQSEKVVDETGVKLDAVRRHIQAAEAAGVRRGGGEKELTETLVRRVAVAARWPRIWITRVQFASAAALAIVM